MAMVATATAATVHAGDCAALALRTTLAPSRLTFRCSSLPMALLMRRHLAAASGLSGGTWKVGNDQATRRPAGTGGPVSADTWVPPSRPAAKGSGGGDDITTTTGPATDQRARELAAPTGRPTAEWSLLPASSALTPGGNPARERLHEERVSPIPKPPAEPRPRVWPYNRTSRLPFPPPGAVRGVPRHELADWSLLRNDMVVQEFINNFFRDGRKAQASAQLGKAFFVIQQRTGENPLTIFHEAIESVTPVMRIGRETRGARSIEVPRPVTPRQGRRLAIVWIMQAADRRKEMKIEDRLASEFINVWKGLSTVNKEKTRVHKACLQHRANARIRLV